ncbi:hypothetical protein GCM10009414_18060 [Tatumella terrea]|uniref:tlde1 domain-containing protein n=1 Tax=Tatumella terrea TaxID=419007 RepID=UPI0031E2C167
MTWTYRVSTRMFFHNGIYRFSALYAGAQGYKDDSQYQYLINKRPLPAGKYRIAAPVNSSTTGYYSLPLIPDAANQMCGRSAFMIHGDSRRDPGTASQGCIVMDPQHRRAIWLSNDHELIVL